MGGPVGPHSCPVLPGPQALRERRSFTYSYYYSYARAGAVGPGSFYASECLGSEKLVYWKPSFREPLTPEIRLPRILALGNPVNKALSPSLLRNIKVEFKSVPDSRFITY